MTGTPTWSDILRDARLYLDLDEDAPVPRDELVAQATANGWGEREVREALRDTDELEAVGSVDDMGIREADPTETAETAESDESAAAEAGLEDANPRGSGRESTEDGCQEPAESQDDGATWRDADFTAPTAGAWPTDLLEREAWMGRQGKLPFAPWGDRNADLECTNAEHAESSTAKCDCDARWKWGHAGHYVDGDTVAIAEDDPQLDGRVFIQQESDPFAFVDGDDVRCPDTGEVHPAFVEILERLGMTYADVSTSGSGAHANYRGELPDGVKQATFAIDDEPWGANDELPEVEIYDGKHVCVATGDHVPGTPLEVRPWDGDELERILDERGELPDRNPAEAHDAFDSAEYDPDATGRDEVTEDIRDVFAALDRLDARAVAEKTIVREWVDPAGTENRAFVPEWAPADYNGTANFVNERAWTDSGTHGGYGGPAALAAIDCDDLPSIDETDVPGEPTGADWYTAVDHLRDLGFSVPKFAGVGGGADTTPDRDPRDVEVTPDADVAWNAADAVVPTDLDEPIALEVGTDGERTGWLCPTTGALVDAVRAVAIAEGHIASAEEPLEGDTYHRAYERAREVHGAPLPRYLTNEDATARFDVLLAAIRECGFFHLDRDALRSDVTAEGDEVGGEAVLALDPAWRESESGKSVLVFESGTIWDADSERTLDVVRFVALDHGRDNPILRHPEAPLEGDAWQKAVAIARGEYGAPLPRWNPGTPDGHVPLLPPSDEIVAEEPRRDADELQQARDDTEALYRDLAEDGDTPSVLTVLPSLGKTTSAVKAAGDTPTTYLAPRKELQADAAAKADDYGVTWRYLPVMGGSLREDVLAAAVDDVREHGKSRLRERWSILAEVDGEDGVLKDGGEDDEDVDLGRPTCGCAEGEHGEEWALVVHVAREIGYTPRDIHTKARALFGAELPCQADGECAYTAAWEAVSDPDAPVDLLIGSYVHAYVESARTHYSRQGHDDRIRREPRTVVVDEFPGVDTFTTTFDAEAFDHVRWLAAALREDVEDLRDVYETDLWSDEFVRAWLDGEADDLPGVNRIHQALSSRERLLAAADGAAEVRDRFDRNDLERHGLKDPLAALASGEGGDREEFFDRIARAVIDLETRPDGDRALPEWGVRMVREEVLDPLEEALDGGLDADPAATDELAIGAELCDLVDRAAEAAAAREDGARGLLEAAAAALQGGDDGVRELAVWSDDGYAHPDANHLLRGVITPADGGATRLPTDGFDFASDGEGTTLDRVAVDGVTTLVDRNGHGAAIHEPPARESGGGDPAPFVGLDATGRRQLWSLALGEEVTTHDIHDTAGERRRFLERALGLQVLQVGAEARAYEGNPEGKDLDGDVALLRELRERFTGVRGARDRDADTTAVGKPACITTKCVRDVLEVDDRLDDVVGAWDNYGAVTGDNDLGEHTLAAILGSQHYGHGAVEYLAALGGEEVTPTGRGMALDYGSELANAYLKHMREDQVMQAALRFTRGESGALVVCRTGAIRDDLPLAGEGRVATTWSETATQLAEAWRGAEGDTFTASELADRAGGDVTQRHVRRVLAELADAGYLRRVREGDGLATEYAHEGGAPEPAEFDLPEAAPPGQDSHTVSYTANVRVRTPDRLLEPGDRAIGSVLPAPEAAAEGDPPG